jgi:hypothetical protein
VSENSADHDESACAKTVSAALAPQAGPKNAAPMTPCFAEHDIPLNRILTERGMEYRSVPTAGLLATFSVGSAT